MSDVYLFLPILKGVRSQGVFTQRGVSFLPKYLMAIFTSRRKNAAGMDVLGCFSYPIKPRGLWAIIQMEHRSAEVLPSQLPPAISGPLFVSLSPRLIPCSFLCRLGGHPEWGAAETELHHLPALVFPLQLLRMHRQRESPGGLWVPRGGSGRGQRG